METTIERARLRAHQDLAPVREAGEDTRKALQANQAQIDEMIGAIGNVRGALWDMLNDKAMQLKIERERLLIEERRLKEALTPLDADFDAGGLRSRLSDFVMLSKSAQPEELQQLFRLAVRRIEWNPQGNHKIQLYHLPKPNNLPSIKAGRQWFHTSVCNDSP